MPRPISFSISCGALLFFALGVQSGRAAATCFAPAGDWITGADLASAAPALAGLPPALKVGYAPVPGLQRVFHPDELRRLAISQGLPDPGLTANLCAAWPLAQLAPDQLRNAMERALAGRAPQIEVLARSLAAAPLGEVVFPLCGLSAYSENPAVWKGYVLYAGTRHFDIWASVRVRVTETHLKAQGIIHAGERMSAGQWRTESYSGPPLREQVLSDPSAIEGLVARREFADGAPLLAVYFEAPKSVERGDSVTVISGVGAAHIEAQAEALSAGHCGDVISVRNPRSNRTFKARITAAGQVEVLPGTSAGLVGSNTPNGNPL
jgi:flagella basal body P-ring formation protein FlgA